MKMANKDDYLNNYREFFENFARTVNPKDQLPVKLATYKLVNREVVGGIIDWTTQYLVDKKCPPSLISHLIKLVIEETRKMCKLEPISCGFNPNGNAYEPLKLMQTVIAVTNKICQRYLENAMLYTLPCPGPPYSPVSVSAIKNCRRSMEDRHVVIHDLNTMFNIQEASPSSYYAIFDGHAGHDAAAYSAVHLHQFLAESKHFPDNPVQALTEAFRKTDSLFLDKCEVEHFQSGTTAVCALLRPKDKTLYIAWVGDSQALLVRQGRVYQCVHPHKPEREDEKLRIQEKGGTVIHWGVWRVNGQLAVSRAIGDSIYKPFVIADPDVREIPLDGSDDFLILACDGLWDFLSEESAARTVYELLLRNPDDVDSISHRLVEQAKQSGSNDNISVIVIFLKDPSKISAEAQWANRSVRVEMDVDLENVSNANADLFAGEILQQKNPFLLDAAAAQAAEERKQNGTGTSPDHPSSIRPKTEGDGDDGNLTDAAFECPEHDRKEPPSAFASFDEKAALETDCDLQKRQSDGFEPREETPTPPADQMVQQDGSVLVDNLGDSADESEDEWNYFKGDQKEQNNITSLQPDQEVAELTSRSSDAENVMSQLNPDAAEFVPISPTRSLTSPACASIMNDQIIAQSPRKAEVPEDVDINLPNPNEFEKEVKSRPGEVYTNGHKTTTQELMEDFLNRKNLDEIDFQPATPNKNYNADEFHFGPNSTPFSTPAKGLDQSEALSTKAVFGDESTASYMDVKNMEEDFLGEFDTSNAKSLDKESDPMSMSFYQDKEESADPLDLNKVQVLPENIDEFLNKPDVPLSGNNDEDELKLDQEQKKLPLSAEAEEIPTETEKEISPSSGIENSIVLTEKTLIESENLVEFENLSCRNVDKEMEKVCLSPEIISPEPEQNTCSRDAVISPEPVRIPASVEPEQTEKTRLDQEEINLCQKSEVENIEEIKTTQEDKFDSFECNFPPLELGKKNVESVAAPNEEILEITKIEREHSTEKKEEIRLPTVDNNLVGNLLDAPLNYAQEISNAVENVTNDVSAEFETTNKNDDDIKSLDSVGTTDVNSFLNRSNLTELTSPLNFSFPESEVDPNTKFDPLSTEEGKGDCTIVTSPENVPNLTIPSQDVLSDPSNISKKDLSSSEQVDSSLSEKQDLSLSEKQDLSASQKQDLSSSEITIEKVEEKTSSSSPAKEISKSTQKTTTTATKSTVAAKSGRLAQKLTPQKTQAAPKLTPTSKSTSTTKTTPKPSPATKQGTAKAATTPSSKTAATMSGLQKTTASGSLPSARAAPKNKPAVSKTSTEGKPLTNGDLQTGKTALAKKTTATSTSAKVAGKTSLGDSKSGRPLTAPAKVGGVKTNPVPLLKPKPSLTSKTTAAAAVKPSSGVTTLKSTTAKQTTTTQKTTTVAAKPKPASAPAPRPKLTTLTKPNPKPADTQKQIKDTVNKLTATRTTTTKTTTLRKTEPKAPTSRTTTSTKTTVTSIKPIKKPTEIVRNPKNKKEEDDKSQQNGINTTLVSHDANVNSEVISKDIETVLVKDDPVDNLIIDNSLLPSEINPIAD